MTYCRECGRSLGDRPAQEIEITPEMIEAGAEAVRGYDFVNDSYEVLFTPVFRAMLAAMYRS